MKNLFLIAMALAALAATGAASAADLAPPVIAKAPPLPFYDWTGFYLGGNIGGSFGRATTSWSAAGAPAGGTSQNLNGIIGGAQAGYNWQTGRWILGLETDIQGSSESGSSAILDPVTTTTPGAPICVPGAPCVPGPPVVTTTNAALSTQEKLPWFGTLRGRIGVTPDPRWMIYATGGLAYGDVQSNGSVTVGGVTATGSSNVLRAGWTAGGGVEAAVTGNWTVKVEYLYVDLGSASNTFAGVAPATPIATSSHVTDNIVRAGFNYRFGRY
jgi:outer membrane immunogenic protein